MSLEQKSCFDAESPGLTVNWHQDEKTVFTGCADGSIKSFDLETETSETIGNHDGSVKDVHWLSESNALLTVSYDKTLRFWDPRQAKHVAGFQLNHKVFCSDLMYPILGLGMSESKLLFLNLPDIQRVLGTGAPNPANYLDSPLGANTQVCSIRLYQGRTHGMAIGGNDGRCNISSFRTLGEPSVSRLDNFMTFRAHKIEDGNRTEQYPLNSLGFHPNKGIDFIYTSGGDGVMYFWDTNVKNKIREFRFDGVPITQTRMDPNGNFLAYSLGYDWARGIQGHLTQPSKIFVHTMDEGELRYQR